MAPPKTQRAIEQHLREAGDADTDELADALGKPRHLIYQCITRWRATDAAHAPRIRAWRRCIRRPCAGLAPRRRAGGDPHRARETDMIPPFVVGLMIGASLGVILMGIIVGGSRGDDNGA